MRPSAPNSMKAGLPTPTTRCTTCGEPAAELNARLPTSASTRNDAELRTCSHGSRRASTSVSVSHNHEASAEERPR